MTPGDWIREVVADVNVFINEAFIPTVLGLLSVTLALIWRPVMPDYLIPFIPAVVGYVLLLVCVSVQHWRDNR